MNRLALGSIALLAAALTSGCDDSPDRAPDSSRIPGPAGPRGPAGPPGPEGPPGAQGPAGADGADGVDGVDGTDGASPILSNAAPTACGGVGGVVMQVPGQPAHLVCNGQPGAPGAKGRLGAPGFTGRSLRIEPIAPFDTAACGWGGGQRLSVFPPTQPPQSVDICGGVNFRSVTTVRQDFDVSPGQFTQGASPCPAGTRVVSGAVNIEGSPASVRMQSSGPSRNLEGWEGLIRNDSAATASFHVIAVCMSDIVLTRQFNDGSEVQDALSL